MKASEAHTLKTQLACDLYKEACKDPKFRDKNGFLRSELCEFKYTDSWKAKMKEMSEKEKKEKVPQELEVPNTELLNCGDYTEYMSLPNLEAAASRMHPEFKNLWKWVKKTYPLNIRVSVPSTSHDFTAVDLRNFLITDLLNMLLLLTYGLTNELNKWKSGLQRGNFVYNLPQATFMNDYEL